MPRFVAKGPPAQETVRFAGLVEEGGQAYLMSLRECQNQMAFA